MPRVLPFAVRDLSLLARRPEHAHELAFDGGAGVGGEAFTVWEGERPLFCGGAVEHHADYATLWASFSADLPRLPVWLVKRVRAFVARQPHARLDCYVTADADRACRFIEWLGFHREATLHGFLPGPRAAAVYRKLGFAHPTATLPEGMA